MRPKPDPNVYTKRCSRCDEEKLLREFYRRPAARDGRFGQCKICCRVAAGEASILKRAARDRIAAARNRRAA